MQIKIFSIPILGGEAINEEMNTFLRSKKILQMEQQLISDTHGAVWSFCIKYVEDHSPFNRNKEKVDYKQVLDEASFERFSQLRVTRKKVALEEGVPAYAIFTDEELAELAKMEQLTTVNMKKVNGIGEKKVTKYGHYFITNYHETS